MILTEPSFALTLYTMRLPKFEGLKHTCRIFLQQQEPTFSQATSNDQNTQNFIRNCIFMPQLLADNIKKAQGDVKKASGNVKP